MAFTTANDISMSGLFDIGSMLLKCDKNYFQILDNDGDGNLEGAVLPVELHCAACGRPRLFWSHFEDLEFRVHTRCGVSGFCFPFSGPRLQASGSRCTAFAEDA